NWSKLKKECTFASLIFGVALVCTSKTMFVTVNAVIATELNVTYSAATALTGVPYIFGGFAALKGHVLSRFFGKRWLYLVSSTTVLLAMVWNMHIINSYAAFMVSRILQGLGWGTFEALVAGSISDMFFVHERRTRMNIFNAVTIFSTWGFPVLGGYLSQNMQGFRNQIMVVNIMQAFSIVFLIFMTPETTFDRSSAPLTPPPFNNDASSFRNYVSTLHIITPYSTKKFTLNAAMRPIRALVAPSTILTALLTAPLLGTAFGIANTISLLFSAMPTFLFPSHIGFLFIMPVLFALITYSATSYISYLRSKPPNHLSESRELLTSTFGMFIGVAGLLSFGLYTMGNLLPQTVNANQTFTLVVTGADLNLNTASALFGLLVAGSVVLYYSGLSHLSSASTPTSPLTTELENASKIWVEFLVGIWIIGVPMWVTGSNGMLVGLKDTSIALTVVCVVLGSTIGAAMWAKG
ncbi:MFS general substrate transporter, partial [Stipitochalara longipes BDJ]